MNTTIKTFWLAGIVLLILTSNWINASEHENDKKETITMEESRKAMETGASTKEKTTELTAPKSLGPIYRPPLRGAPAGRVAGGTRGEGEIIPVLNALAPEHVGLTTNSQPNLYYFISRPTSLPLEFTLIEKHAVYPLVEARLATPETGGVQAIRLSDYGQKLSPGIEYRWFVAIVSDASHRSKDILASGAIELVNPSVDLQEKLQHADSVESAYVYAEAGFWYDTLTALSVALGQATNKRKLISQRASLFEQVGLYQAAQHELRH